jgi:hypothetical protein
MFGLSGWGFRQREIVCLPVEAAFGRRNVIFLKVEEADHAGAADRPIWQDQAHIRWAYQRI